MKQRLFTLLLISAIGFASCRKDKYEPTIKQFDQTQIENYISANGITGMKKDTSNGGDTTGIYYKIILPGNGGTPVDYPDMISYVYTIRSFDGKYISTDTISNHFEDYLGHIASDNLPVGLELAIKNVLKYKGASMRVLIPSHLAYGINGYGTGSKTNTSTRIAGNQCLDYYVHLIDKFPAYDDQVIKNFLSANSLTGYTAVQSTLLPGNTYYYKVLTNGTGSNAITSSSTITATYTGQLLNGTVFDGSYNGTNSTTLTIADLVPGVIEGLSNFAVAGTKISLIIPSTLAYGDRTQSNIPVNSCLRFTFQVITTTP
ncbi:FKBP-type peptidyl-prolyl cis-trans isomerase [Mucilaginibacter sp.]|uniref:FKBP-type peptidyl-prolyl cis-trans isomerase n=1 Tax=Mucilaginibacter sp. TaxID=1882438 RepID=UPI003D1032C4